MRTYELSGGDGGAYGPIFGPVQAKEVSLIFSGEHEYLLLRLVAPIQYKEEQIEFFVVSPRYSGDTFPTLRNEGCTVGVGRVLPGKEADVEIKGVTDSNVEYWSIGSCTPLKA